MYQEEQERDSQAGRRTGGIARMIVRVIAAQNARRIGKVIAGRNVRIIGVMTGQNPSQNPIPKKQVRQRGRESEHSNKS